MGCQQGQSAGEGAGVHRRRADHRAQVHSPGRKAGPSADTQGAVSKRGKDLDSLTPTLSLEQGLWLTP